MIPGQEGQSKGRTEAAEAQQSIWNAERMSGIRCSDTFWNEKPERRIRKP